MNALRRSGAGIGALASAASNVSSKGSTTSGLMVRAVASGRVDAARKEQAIRGKGVRQVLRTLERAPCIGATRDRLTRVSAEPTTSLRAWLRSSGRVWVLGAAHYTEKFTIYPLTPRKCGAVRQQAARDFEL